jgi:hypothetical protein
LKIDFEVDPSLKKINHKSKSVFLGSCFSDDIAKKFVEGGLEVLSNPFGTLFHPKAIANLFDEIEIESTCFQRGDIWFSWLTSGVIYAMSKEELVHKIEALKKELIQSVKEADFLFITFGTAFGYRLSSSGKFVANCHKIPLSLFVKELTGVKEMVEVWENLIDKIKELNPNIHIVYTISPVRHVKDGVHENNISKSYLFYLIHQLKGDYFPSYEIVNDELRDYRFFKEDLVHPNEQAINYVWSKFRNTFMDISANLLIDEVLQIRQMLNHSILYPESIESSNFIHKLNQKKDAIEKILPNIKW